MNATPGGPQPGTDPSEQDEVLLAELRGVIHRADPGPDDLTPLGRSLLAWRHPEAELAELVADSRELAGAVRGEGDVVLHFRAGPIEIVAQFSRPAGGLHRLVGQVEPAGAGRLRVRRVTNETEVAVDELGRFVTDDLLPGPISLGWSPAADPPEADNRVRDAFVAIETSWQIL